MNNFIMLSLITIPISCWPDPYCDQGQRRGIACFLPSCTQLGGVGCRDECCYFFFDLPTTPYCDEVESGISCKIREADPDCQFGVRRGPACFPSGCSQFGNAGCQSPCCYFEYVTDARPSCDVAGPGCRVEECHGDLALDIVFLIDESSSISLPDFATMNSFIAGLVKQDVNDISTVSLVSFGQTHLFEQFLDFTLTDDDGKIIIMDTVTNNPSHRGNTFTADALKRTLELFELNTRPDILLLFTDGIHDGPSPCSIIDDNDIGDVEIVVIGIGQMLDFNRILGSEYNCLYNDASNDVFKIEEFDSAAFNAKQAEIRQKICRDCDPTQQICTNSAVASILLKDDYQENRHYANNYKHYIDGDKSNNNIVEIIGFNVLISIITSLSVIGLCICLYFICSIIKSSQSLPIYTKVSVNKYDDDENLNV